MRPTWRALQRPRSRHAQPSESPWTWSADPGSPVDAVGANLERRGTIDQARIVVVSADMGAGHDTAARELSRRLLDEGFQVHAVNLLDVLPCSFGRALKAIYRGMLSRLPWSYDLLFTITNRSPLSMSVIRGALRPARRRLQRQLPPDTRAVVTTYPFANQILGPLRQGRHLAVPVITYVTDFAVHPGWVAPGVDTYCTMHHAGLKQAEAIGAVDVRLVRPLISARFGSSSVTKQQARRRLGLPDDGHLALIVAGSWGVGNVEITAAEVNATECARPVVVCGRNDLLYRRLRQRPGYVFGWVDDMATLMRAVDVVVENAGGLTSQEAMACGLPVVTYRPIAGHGKANAAMMAEARVSAWVQAREELEPTLADVIDRGRGTQHRTPRLPLQSPDLASVVASAAADTPRTAPGRRMSRMACVIALVGEAIAVFVALTGASDTYTAAEGWRPR